MKTRRAPSCRDARFKDLKTTATHPKGHPPPRHRPDKVNPVNFKWKWGEDELLIADQYTYLGVDISKDCSWDAHIHSEINKKG